MEGRKDLAKETALRVEFAHFLAENAERIPDAVDTAGAELATTQELAAGLNLAESGWRTLYEQGILATARGEAERAKALYRSAVSKVEQLRSGLSQQEQQQSLIDTEAVRDLYRRALSSVAAGETDDATLEIVERARARSFLDSLQGKRFRTDPAAISGGAAELAEIEKRISASRVELTPRNEGVLRSAGHDPALLKMELARLEDRFQLARQESALTQDRSAHMLAANPVSLKRVRELLPPGTALVEYGLVNDGLVALVANRAGSRRTQWKTNPEQLRKDVLRLRTLLASDGGGDEWKTLLRGVSERVSAPAIKLLPAGTSRIIVVAADYLQYLPFQVLETADGEASVDRYAVSYLPSASVLEFLPRRWRPVHDVFLGALGDTAIEGWPPLPGTVRETASIAGVFPAAPHAYGPAFTHDAARDALLHHEAVHFATHGLLDETAPLFSALLVAGDEGSPTRLSLYELTDMRIQARLVVLSACETGLGKISGGDEMSGLTRTFLAAGANTVVSSLWKVSDDSTALLMAGFYRRLRAGESPATALRKAALEVRAKFPHPFYWAPFIVTGNG